MATLSRPQLVLKSIADAWATHDTLQITKTAAHVNGTILKADEGLATATELAGGTYDVGFIIDDLSVNEAEVGDVMTVRVLKRPEWTVLRGSELRLSATVLTDAQVLLFKAGSKPVDVQ